MKRVNLYNLTFLVFSFIILTSAQMFSQETDPQKPNEADLIKRNYENLQHRLDVLEKSIDDIIWFQRVGSAAFIDKVE